MAVEEPNTTDVVVIGAGPAGLTAAYKLGQRGQTCTVFESDDVVGGISRTVERDGWRFDIGGHRFFTKVSEVEDFWHEILPKEDFLMRPRMSRIYYNNKFFDYPLKAGNALKNLGILEAVRCVLSYLWARVRPPKDQSNFEGWVAARFGWRLYRIFFKTYTEKVWGVPATEIQADWAAQRIKNLSLFNAVMNALLPKRNQKDITSLIEEFQYPKYGPGMMWEVCTEKVEAQGSKVVMETRITSIRHSNGQATSVVVESEGGQTEHPCSHIISSMPMSALVMAMDPPAPAEVQAAAKGLGYRDFLTVALVVPESAGFPDNWIYVHSPEVRLGRIQNFGSWSPYLVKEGRTCLGLEYFVFEGDDLWASDRRRPRRARQAGAGEDRPGQGVRRRDRLRGADAQGLSRLRRDVPGQRRHDAGLDRSDGPQRLPGRPQRDAPLQQPGPLDVHRHAVGGEHPRRRPRHLERQRRGGVPRGEDGRRAATASSGTGRAAPITPRRAAPEVVIPDEAEVEAG